MSIDRRKFLRMGANTSAAAVAFAALPLSIRNALAVTPAIDTGTISSRPETI
jgi:phospholipase C